MGCKILALKTLWAWDSVLQGIDAGVPSARHVRQAPCAYSQAWLRGWPVVQEAVKHTEYDRLRGSQGKGPGLMGSWPVMAMTFVDNHDTGKQGTSSF